MAVKIDLELDAADVQAKIASVATELEALEAVADGFELDIDDIDDIAEQLDGLDEALANIDLGLNQLDTDLREAARMLDEAEVSVSPSASTGDGDSTGNDPPEQNFNIGSGFNEVANRLSADGSGDEDGSGVLDIGKLKKDIGQAYGIDPRSLTHQGTRSEADFRDMPWNELQQKASEVGAYGNIEDSDPSKKRLAQEIAKQQRFKGQEFTVDSDKLGTVGLEDYIDNRDSRTDIDAPEIGGGFGRRAGINSFQDIIDDNNVLRRLDGIKSKSDAFDALGDGLDNFGGKFRRLKPTMGKFMQLLAALIPIAVALGTQLLGVAAAMGAVGAAGGAIIGLGLLGHADSLQGSIQQAKQELRGLKTELFEAFQPAMQQFAPIQSRAFDSIPEALDPVAEEMENLTQYEDTLFNLGGMLAGGMEEALVIINENEQAISQLTTRFGGLIGAGLLDFFEWLIQAASDNQRLIMELGGSLISLAKVAFNLSMVIGRVIGAMRPFFQILSALSGLLNDPLIVGILTFIAVAGGMFFILSKMALLAWGAYTSIQALSAALLFLGNGSLISGAIKALSRFAGYIGFLIGELTLLQGVLLTTFALLSAVTLGGALVAGIGAFTAAKDSVDDEVARSVTGGPDPSSGGGSRGGETTINDNRSYTFKGDFDDFATKEGVKDIINESDEEEEATELPDI